MSSHNSMALKISPELEANTFLNPSLVRLMNGRFPHCKQASRSSLSKRVSQECADERAWERRRVSRFPPWELDRPTNANAPLQKLSTPPDQLSAEHLLLITRKS